MLHVLIPTLNTNALGLYSCQILNYSKINLNWYVNESDSITVGSSRSKWPLNHLWKVGLNHLDSSLKVTILQHLSYVNQDGFQPNKSKRKSSFRYGLVFLIRRRSLRRELAKNVQD